MTNAWDRLTQPPSPLPPGAPAPSAPAEAVTRVLKRTRQTRDFLPTPVPDAALTDILDVARWTGSAGNRQPWTFIVITDADVRRRLAEAAPYTAHIGIAPVVVGIALEQRGDAIDSFEEARLTERMQVAATAHGLASGLARLREEAQAVAKQLLGIPDGIVVRSMVSLGYPTEAAKAPKSAPGAARKPLADVVRRERFG